MNPNKKAKKKATAAPEAPPQEPQTSNVKASIEVPPRLSYCHNCRKNTKSDLSVPYCDRNPPGLAASAAAEQHGNIIAGMATCDDDYCDPQERPLEEFHALAGKDAMPQEIFARCRVCQHLKQPDLENSKPARRGRPQRKKRQHVR